MNTGNDFIKKLKPLGCALVLICFAGFLMVCFSSGNSTLLEDYSPPMDSAYYAGHISELYEEISKNVLPELPGAVYCAEEDGRVALEIKEDGFFAARSALLKHFDESLLDLRMVR
ncbi:MAG: hypothetical protein ACOX81_08625 [Candidatus Heteroscillospira sp.]|jgi:hypothetical protein